MKNLQLALEAPIYIKSRDKNKTKANKKYNNCKSTHEFYKLLIPKEPFGVEMVNIETGNRNYYAGIGNYILFNENIDRYNTEEEAKAAAQRMHNFIIEDLKHPERDIVYNRK